MIDSSHQNVAIELRRAVADVVAAVGRRPRTIRQGVVLQRGESDAFRGIDDGSSRPIPAATKESRAFAVKWRERRSADPPDACQE